MGVLVKNNLLNMKNIKSLYSVASFLILISASSFPGEGKMKLNNIVPQDTLGIYKDGIYEGRSRAGYTDEPFWGIVRLKIKDGRFTEVTFMIRDSALHEDFNDRYARHFEGIPEYIEQCRNDWGGVNTYPGKLIQAHDTTGIDAISGATWSFNIFRASVSNALKAGGNIADTISSSLSH